VTPQAERGRALVTGASSGIGLAFCERLARDGWDLVLVARRQERLDALAERLRSRAGRRVDVVVADLGTRAGMRTVEDLLASEPIVLLVNNAGFMNHGHLHELDRDSEAECIEVLCQAVMRLTHAALPGMLERGRGTVIQVASRAGLQPHTRAATYSAAKAFVVAFTQVLQRDYSEGGLRFQALCPGATRTEIFERAGIDPAGILESTWMEPEEVVDASLADLERGELVCIPGQVGRGEWIRKLVPAAWLRRVAGILRRLARV